MASDAEYSCSPLFNLKRSYLLVHMVRYNTVSKWIEGSDRKANRSFSISQLIIDTLMTDAMMIGAQTNRQEIMSIPSSPQKKSAPQINPTPHSVCRPPIRPYSQKIHGMIGAAFSPKTMYDLRL